MKINDPVVLAELMDRHTVYERALIDNDVAVLASLFWDSPHALRYGVAENLYGAAEIEAFRRNRPKMNLDREIRRLEVLALGDSAGIVNLEFARPMDGIERIGRQTQFWFRMEGAWKIVSAHVSLLPAAPSYQDAVSARIGLKIDPATRAEVNENLARISAIAGFLMEFPLSQDVEAAPVFQP